MKPEQVDELVAVARKTVRDLDIRISESDLAEIVRDVGEAAERLVGDRYVALIGERQCRFEDCEACVCSRRDATAIRGETSE